MKEYIERETALEIVKRTSGDYATAFCEIAKIPVADVVEVVHGKWMDKGWDGDMSFRIDGRGNCWRVIQCSCCEKNLCGQSNTLYCPHCGAKMDLEDCDG